MLTVKKILIKGLKFHHESKRLCLSFRMNWNSVVRFSAYFYKMATQQHNLHCFFFFLCEKPWNPSPEYSRLSEVIHLIIAGENL